MRPKETVFAKAIQVTPRKNETPERMLRRFMKKVRNEGILKECLDRRYHVKKSTKRRKKRAMSRWNALRDVRN